MISKDINNKDIYDWIELYVAIEGQVSKTFLQSNFDHLDNTDDVDDIFLVLSNRLDFYGENKPYKIEGDMVTSELIEETELKRSYIFSVLLSIYGNGTQTQKVGKIFERLSNEAFRVYLGGESFVFGYPNESSEPLAIQLNRLAEGINEKRGGIDPPESAKDAKLDLVSFHPIDSRENKLVILTQSASGKDWRQKLTELSLDQWRDYIAFSNIPVRGFSAPVFIDKKEAFWHESKRAGILFDRPRLYRFISRLSSFGDVNLNEDLTDIITRLLSEYTTTLID